MFDHIFGFLFLHLLIYLILFEHPLKHTFLLISMKRILIIRIVKLCIEQFLILCIVFIKVHCSIISIDALSHLITKRCRISGIIKVGKRLQVLIHLFRINFDFFISIAHIECLEHLELINDGLCVSFLFFLPL